MLDIARRHYGDRFEFIQFDAQAMPFDNSSIDVVIIFEASYYLPQPERFVAECARVLRSGGVVLLATANKDLFDFNPSPYSHFYHGTVELNKLFSDVGFSVECFGYMPVDELTWKQKVLRPIKKFAVDMGLIPKTMAGKKLLKKLVFGGLVKMPAEITAGRFAYVEPMRLDTTVPDTRHKVLYCAARKTEN
jgi:ubiquinone/menaquinone biosynthesis C-methylase UbiE